MRTLLDDLRIDLGISADTGSVTESASENSARSSRAQSKFDHSYNPQAPPADVRSDYSALDGASDRLSHGISHPDEIEEEISDHNTGSENLSFKPTPSVRGDLSAERGDISPATSLATKASRQEDGESLAPMERSRSESIKSLSEHTRKEKRAFSEEVIDDQASEILSDIARLDNVSERKESIGKQTSQVDDGDHDDVLSNYSGGSRSSLKKGMSETYHGEPARENSKTDEQGTKTSEHASTLFEKAEDDEDNEEDDYQVDTDRPETQDEEKSVRDVRKDSVQSDTSQSDVFGQEEIESTEIMNKPKDDSFEKEPQSDNQPT